MAEKTFTEALSSLKSAASKIGMQSTTFEEAMKLYEDGMKEAEYCRKILDSADQKIQIYDEKGGLSDAQF